MSTPTGLSIVDVGRYLKGLGLDIGEHREFGGVTGGHAKNSHHYYDEAIDVRDWRPDVAPEYEGGAKLHWKERTARLRDRARQLGVFDEALGPGDKGHDTHFHLALRGQKPITQQQLEYLGTGRWKADDGTFLTTVPGAGEPAGRGEGAPAASNGEDAALEAATMLARANLNTPLTEVAMPMNTLQSAATELRTKPAVAAAEPQRKANPLGILEWLGVL